MKNFVEDFNKTFPKFAISEFADNTSIVEQSNDDNGKFKELILSGLGGFSFCHDFASKISSCPKGSGNQGCLQKDCDGILLFEYKEKNYLILSELKSKFDVDNLAKAKDQLVGTFINLRATLSVLQNVDLSNYSILGLIACYEPNNEIISAISKREDKKASFAIKLNSEHKYLMPKTKCDRFYGPLKMCDFQIVYIPVPENKTSYSANITEIIDLVDN